MTASRIRFGANQRQVKGLYVLIMLMALLLAACGQQPPPEEDPPEAAVTVELSAATVTLLRGDEVTLAVTVTRTGPATDAAELALEGSIPAGMTATFEPQQLTGTQLVSQLTLAAEASAEPATLALEVVADVGESSASQTLTVDIEGLTVTGRVEDDYGRPLPGGRAGSQGQTV
ncbi:MAG TPA: hypothetical protein VKZ43_06185, partial [Trueperaceae bacterium]|nr:hypothetical protein [Trueperaceae bacterium]